MKFALIICLFFALNVSAQDRKASTIYLVRHAEKSMDNSHNKDPFLSKSGLKRAKLLANKLKRIHISAIYCTDFQRTKQTAIPTAEKQHVTIKLYDPRQLKLFADSLLQNNKGESVLVVGHSNTVLETIEALGGQRPISTICEHDFDFFFVVNIKADGKTEVKFSRYGDTKKIIDGK